MEFPLWCNGIGSIFGGGAQVWSLAQQSGLGIWRCCSCSLGPNCGLDLIPDPITPYAAGWPKKKQKKTKKNKTKHYLSKEFKQRLKKNELTINLTETMVNKLWFYRGALKPQWGEWRNSEYWDEKLCILILIQAVCVFLSCLWEIYWIS